MAFLRLLRFGFVAGEVPPFDHFEAKDVGIVSQGKRNAKRRVASLINMLSHVKNHREEFAHTSPFYPIQAVRR